MRAGEVQKIRAFEHLCESFIASGTGSIIDYNCPYPKHEFLKFLVERKDVLLDSGR